MNKELFKEVFKSGWLLSTFALAGVMLLNIVYTQTLDRIADNERVALMARLIEVVDEGGHDNDLLADTIELPASLFHSNKPVTVYRARKQGIPTAAIFVVSTSKGYAGTIQMVVGVRMDKTLSGVRVVKHTETPGLGDKMEIQKSPWILGFNNTSMSHPKLSQWAVKKDGGYFDQFTGATITPRAIVGAVKHVVIWANEGNHLASVFEKAMTVKTLNKNQASVPQPEFKEPES